MTTRDTRPTPRQRRFRWVVPAALLMAACAAAWILPLGRWGRHYRADAPGVNWMLREVPVREPSAIAFHPGRGTLLIASDEGYVSELDQRLRPIDRHEIPGDLEGLAIHPVTGTLFVAVESFQAILEYDLEPKRILRCLYVDLQAHPLFADKRLDDDKGIEGITITGDARTGLTLLAVVQGDPALLVELDADLSAKATADARRQLTPSGVLGVRQRAEVRRTFDLGVPRLSDVTYDAQSRKLFVLCSKDAVLLLVDREGNTRRSVRLPGYQPEGLAFLPDGRALITDDDGGVWVSREFRRQLLGNAME